MARKKPRRAPAPVRNPPKTIAGFKKDSIDRVILDGAKFDLDLADASEDIGVERTTEGGSTVTVDLVDDDQRLVDSGILDADGDALLDNDIVLRLDGLGFALARIECTHPEYKLTFEDWATLMFKSARGPLKAYRDQMTYAEFIWMGVRKIGGVNFYSPELRDKQPIAKPDVAETADEDAADRGRAGNDLQASDNLKMKGDDATPYQLRNAEIALNVGANLGANKKAMLALLVAGIGESVFREVVNSLGYGGVFQGQVETGGRYFKKTDTAEMARYFMTGGKGFQGGGALKLSKTNMSPGEIATTVEASGKHGSFYGVYEPEARAILAAYGGATPGSDDTGEVEVEERFAYKVKKDESYWKAWQVYAQDLAWRLFCVGNTLVYMSEEEMIRQRPAMAIMRRSTAPENLPHGVQAVEKLDWTLDRSHTVQEIDQVVMDTARWAAQPGQCVVVGGEGDSADGRYITANVSRSLYNPETTAKLARPQRKKAEPAAERSSVSIGAGGSSGGSGGGGGKLQSPFGGARKFPVSGAYGTQRPGHIHAGLDVGVPSGTPCIAPFNGTITHVSTSGFGTAGGMIHLRADSDIAGTDIKKGDKIGWGHISRSALKSGQTVHAGQRVATSNGSPPHVHFVYIRGGGGSIDGNADPTKILRQMGGI